MCVVACEATTVPLGFPGSAEGAISRRPTLLSQALKPNRFADSCMAVRRARDWGRYWENWRAAAGLLASAAGDMNAPGIGKVWFQGALTEVATKNSIRSTVSGMRSRD